MTAPNNTDDMSKLPDVAPQPSGRWVRIALAISLAINLGIAGIVAGAFFRDGGPMHGGRMTRDLGFGPFTEALSKDDRAELRRAFLAKLPEMRDDRHAMREDISALLAQLRATPFDATRLREAFDRQNQRNAKRLELGQQLIFDLLVGMTDETRQAFAGRLEQSLAKGPKRRDGQAAP
jgi:uncharacterized membrane protein